jgi:hypothetical protein
MRTVMTGCLLLVLSHPAAARGQSWDLRGSAGPTLTDTGHSITAGAGFSPTSRLTVSVGLERTHLVTRTSTDGRGGVSRFRGGTLLLGTAELRFAPFRTDRVGPYALVGLAAGQSRPNVNAAFPQPVTNEVRAAFAGGGLLVPLGERLTIYADVRMMVGAEGIEGIVAVAPARAGVALRF